MTGDARVLLLALTLVGATVSAQSPVVEAGAVFRVFLKNGDALPSYGEFAEVGDRVVFTLLVGADDRQRALQLISLPSNTVDLERTRRYADAIRLTHYTATRGEVDYAAMTQEVQRALTELTSVTDPKKRLAMAEEARRRLLAWAASTYGYRAVEIQELTRLFDEVIAELRAAAGERQFALDLRTGSAPPAEPLLPLPSLGESIQLAMAASEASDSEDDRLAILRAAAALLGSDPAAADLHARVTHAIDLETKATQAYGDLAGDVRARAAEARRRGDAESLANTMATLFTRDQDLGRRRPQLVVTLTSEIETMLATVRTHRAALDHYAIVRRSLLEYEHAVRPTMSGFDGLLPVFNAVRDIRFTAYARLERAGVRLKGFLAALDQISPPEDLVDVHATLMSALRMADHACARRRLAYAIRSEVIAAEASSAAAGAMLLAGQARGQLVARLYPPKIQ